MRRKAGKSSVTLKEFEDTTARCAETTDVLAAEMQQRRDAVIAEYRTSRQYQQDVVGLLRPDLERALGSVHDYKQFVQQILQNMEVLLESRTPGLPIMETLDHAAHEERAIYWAARMMDERLDAALLVLNPGRITTSVQRKRHRLHGLVTKYLKIYQRRIEAKKLHMRKIGESWSEVEANIAALTIIPHALIDNATKYAPEGTDIHLGFSEDDGWIKLRVASYGPVIREDEKNRIFDLFYRGVDASSHFDEGTGFGLGAAQLIAEQLGTKITMSQDGTVGPKGSRWTEFCVSFAIAPVRTSPSGRTTIGKRQ